MQVNEKLWKQTAISNILSIFPGVLGEFLQRTTPQEILRAEKFLPHIFWRWYMLEHPSFHSSPYYYLDWRRKKEKWPQGGQFFPKPTLLITKTDDAFLPHQTKPQVQINITVDYISFEEQPLIIDVINTMQGKPLQYHYDTQYSKAIDTLAAHCRKDKLSPESIKTNPTLLLHEYFRQSLSEWHKSDPFIKTAFSEKEWLLFWKDLMLLSGRKDGLSTDGLLDIFVERVRKVYPDYGIKSAELELVNKEKDIDINVKVQYFFWLSCAHYVLLPLSLYTHLLVPIFIEQSMFQKDIEELIARDFTDPMPIYAPFTTLTLAPFGKRFLEKSM